MVNNWNAVDERCPHCNSVIKHAQGINRQNLKKLFWSKPSPQDIIIFIMLVLCLILAWTYYSEIAQYKFIYENPEEFCNSYWSQKSIQELPPLLGLPSYDAGTNNKNE